MRYGCVEYLDNYALIMVNKLKVYRGTQPIRSFFALEPIQFVRKVILNNADAKDYGSRFRKADD